MEKILSQLLVEPTTPIAKHLSKKMPNSFIEGLNLVRTIHLIPVFPWLELLHEFQASSKATVSSIIYIVFNGY